MNKLKINFIGTGIEIKRILLPQEVLENWKQKIGPKKTITEALLDPFFYYKLKDKKYTSLEDLTAEKCGGLLHNPKSQIEFWFNRKKVFKVSPSELTNENLLFPLFNIDKSQTPFTQEKGIYILQHEIGTVGTYELMVNTTTLNIDDFLFEIHSAQATSFIRNIKFQNQNLKFIKKDTMITYQTGFDIK